MRRAFDRRARIALAAAVAVLVLGAGTVRANGRFPAPTSIIPAPGCAATEIWATTTFGFLVSHDAGKSWHWLCEPAVGVSGPYDPVLRIASDGTLYSTTFMGLAVSADDGCDFTRPSSGLSSAWISDVELQPGAPGTLWATTQTTGNVTNGIYRSSDGGATWTAAYAASGEYFTTLRFAPSNPLRIYASSTAVMQSGTTISYQAHATVSSDGGATWTPHALGVASLGDTSILAVNPVNADEAYMRTEEGAATGDGGYRYYVLKTTDAGQTWQPILSLTNRASGIATSEDGMTLYVATLDTGLRTSKDDGATWSAPATSPHLQCLTERCGHLYACGNNWSDKWAFGRSDDGGATWTGLLRFADMCGPDPMCGASSGTQATCSSMWPALASMFGATCGAVATDGSAAMPPVGAHGCCSIAGAGASTGESMGNGLLLLLALGLACLARRWSR